jgi:putative transposase
MSEKRFHRKSFHEPGHAHELTFGCYRGLNLLSKERTCEWLAESIRESCQVLEISLWAYVFMPNHVHLIIHPKRHRYDIGEILKQIKQPVSRKALAFLRKSNPDWMERLKQQRGKRTEYHFWQRGGGYDRNITEAKTLLSMIEYIHLNPVRKGLAEVSRDWRWSSAGWFEGLSPNSLPVDPIPPEWLMD